MKRSPLPPRQKPLKAGAPLQRSQPLRRSTLTRTPPRAREARTVAPVPSQGRKRTGPTRQTRDLVRARDRGVCVRCGGPGSTTHHRVNRAMGGSSDPTINAPSSLLWICRPCNGAMEDNPGPAYEAGWKVRRPTVAATVPVQYPDGTWLLDDNGGRRKAEEGVYADVRD